MSAPDSKEKSPQNHRQGNPFLNLSLGGKFYISFLFLIIISVGLCAVGISNIRKQVAYGENVFLYSAEPNSYMAEISISFNKMVVALHDTALAPNAAEFERSAEIVKEEKLNIVSLLELYMSTVDTTDITPVESHYANNPLPVKEPIDAASAATVDSVDESAAESEETAASEAENAEEDALTAASVTENTEEDAVSAATGAKSDSDGEEPAEADGTTDEEVSDVTETAMTEDTSGLQESEESEESEESVAAAEAPAVAPEPQTATVDAASGATTSVGKMYAVADINYMLDQCIIALDEIRPLARQGDRTAALQVFDTRVKPGVTVIASCLESMLGYSMDDADSLQGQMRSSRDSSTILMLGALAVSVLTCIGLGMLLIHLVVRPIKLVSRRASRVAAGYFETSEEFYGKDEVGELTRSVDDVSQTYLMLIEEMTALVEAHDQGYIDYRIDQSKFDAAYRDIVVKMNNMVESYTTSTVEILGCVESFGKGNFEAPLRQFPNQKALANKTVEELRAELRRVSATLTAMVGHARQGDLSQRANLSEFEGDWKYIAGQLNGMMESVFTPIDEAVSVLNEFSKGKLSVQVHGDYNGSFLEMKTALNATLKSISSYVQEISQVLAEISNNNLTVGIDREYLGDFAQVKDSITQIVSQFNGVLHEINDAAETVSNGSGSISQSSASLAEGASFQKTSIETLMASIDNIRNRVLKSSEDATVANEFSLTSQQNAELGSNDMKRMMVSMDGIKEASNNISRIIKIIQDIAFQTNLLALNAAIEAARAGEHGKGFAIVAEEVGNLAHRSQKAAQETTLLVEESISKVNEGTRLAEVTSEALDKIVQSVSQVSSIISDIASESAQQATAMTDISIEVEKISDVVTTSSGAAEESASEAANLSEQSLALRTMTSVFELKR